MWCTVFVHIFRLPFCILWKLSILSPLWQCRSYFPPTLPLECLSMRLALAHLWMPPNTELAQPRGTHTHTHIPTETVPGRPQTCYHTAQLSGTSFATVSPNHYPAPRLIDPASGQASPAQLCVIQPRPGWHKSTLHPHHPLHPSPRLPHPNLAHHLSLDGWGLGIDGRLVASVLAITICLVSPRKARGAVARFCQPAS